MGKSNNQADDQEKKEGPISKIRQTIANILEKPDEDKKANVFDWFLIILISLNAIAVIVTSIKGVHNKDYKFFYYFEFFSIVIFTIEYLLRIWTAPRNKASNSKKTWLGYIFSFYGIVDLFAILPFYLSRFFVIDLRILRGLRLLRFLKLGRYNNSLQLITKVFKKEKEKLLTTVFIMIILILLASSMMYFFESEAQPEKFHSIPATLWWTVATLTTVGGDIYPITVMGKILGSIISILGIGLFAMPSGIIAMGLIQEIRSSPADPENIYSVLSTLDKYMDHINSALDAACKELNKRSQKYSIAGNDVYRDKYRYGRYLRDDRNERDDLFFGLTPLLSDARNGKEFVYSLYIPKESIKHEKIKKKEYPYFLYDDGLYIQIDKNLFEEEDASGKLCGKIVDIIRNVYEEYGRW